MLFCKKKKIFSYKEKEVAYGKYTFFFKVQRESNSIVRIMLVGNTHWLFVTATGKLMSSKLILFFWKCFFLATLANVYVHIFACKNHTLLLDVDNIQ
jgi:hypothetical protein